MCMIGVIVRAQTITTCLESKIDAAETCSPDSWNLFNEAGALQLFRRGVREVTTAHLAGSDFFVPEFNGNTCYYWEKECSLIDE